MLKNSEKNISGFAQIAQKIVRNSFRFMRKSSQKIQSFRGNPNYQQYYNRRLVELLVPSSKFMAFQKTLKMSIIYDICIKILGLQHRAIFLRSFNFIFINNIRHLKFAISVQYVDNMCSLLFSFYFITLLKSCTE